MQAFAKDFEAALALFEREPETLTHSQVFILWAVDALTAGVEGAWCSPEAVTALAKRHGVNLGKLVFDLVEKGLLITSSAGAPHGQGRPYSRASVFYHTRLIALTKDGAIEQVAQAYRLAAQAA